MDQFWSVVRGAVIAAIGALLAYLSQLVVDYSPTLGPAVAAVLAIVVNAIRKAFEAWRDRP